MKLHKDFMLDKLKKYYDIVFYSRYFDGVLILFDTKSDQYLDCVDFFIEVGAPLSEVVQPVITWGHVVADNKLSCWQINATHAGVC